MKSEVDNMKNNIGNVITSVLIFVVVLVIIGFIIYGVTIEYQNKEIIEILEMNTMKKLY